MKQTRRHSLLAFDLALLGALLGGCASPPPGAGTVSVARRATYVARPEFAGLVPLSPCVGEFADLVPLTPPDATVSSYARALRSAPVRVAPAPVAPAPGANPADWVPSVLPSPIVAGAPAANSAEWVPSVAPALSFAAVDTAAPVRAGKRIDRRTTLELSLIHI